METRRAEHGNAPWKERGGGSVRSRAPAGVQLSVAFVCSVMSKKKKDGQLETNISGLWGRNVGVEVSNLRKRRGWMKWRGDNARDRK